jgi:hypothetical protein
MSATLSITCSPGAAEWVEETLDEINGEAGGPYLSVDHQAENVFVVRALPFVLRRVHRAVTARYDVWPSWV